MSVAISTQEHRGSVLTRVAAAASIALALALGAWGTYGEPGDQGNGDYLVVAVIIAVGAAVVFGWAVPKGLRKEAAGGTALALSVLALLAIAVFWSGLPTILAAGAIVLGLEGWNARDRAWMCRAAVVVGALAVAADILVYIADMT
jgi:hypothetical protein